MLYVSELSIGNMKEIISLFSIGLYALQLGYCSFGQEEIFEHKSATFDHPSFVTAVLFAQLLIGI